MQETKLDVAEMRGLQIRNDKRNIHVKMNVEKENNVISCYHRT